MLRNWTVILITERIHANWQNGQNGNLAWLEHNPEMAHPSVQFFRRRHDLRGDNHVVDGDLREKRLGYGYRFLDL